MESNINDGSLYSPLDESKSEIRLLQVLTSSDRYVFSELFPPFRVFIRL